MIAVLLVILLAVDTASAASNRLNFNIKELSEMMRHYHKGVCFNGQLTVHGNRLVNRHDKILQLKGLSSHGILWFPEYTNYRSIMTTRDYGANVFRLAMYTSGEVGYIGHEEASKDALYMALENALGTDMYVIVDWHILEDGDPNLHVDEAVELFSEVSSKYPKNPAIIYEICNEPNGDVNWDDIKKYADRVIPAIRKNSPDALIIVGTPEYSTDLWSVADSPLKYKNVIYSYHFYTGIENGEYEITLKSALRKGIPVFVSEWGMRRNDETGEFDYKEAKGFLDFLDENEISWVNWSLSNKDEEYAIIKPTEEKLSNWTYDELTPNGKFILTIMGR